MDSLNLSVDVGSVGLGSHYPTLNSIDVAYTRKVTTNQGEWCQYHGVSG